MGSILSFRALIPVGIVLSLLATGWTARGWYADAQTLAAERGAQAAIDAARSRESSIAEAAEQRLADLRTTERVIDRGVIREIQKPIYRRVCVGDAGIRLLNAAAAGREPDAADAVDDVPGDAATSH